MGKYHKYMYIGILVLAAVVVSVILVVNNSSGSHDKLEDKTENKTSLSATSIIGICIGAGIFVAAMIGFYYLYYKQHHKSLVISDSPSTDDDKYFEQRLKKLMKT